MDIHERPLYYSGVIAIFTCLIGIHVMIFVQWELGCGYLFYERLGGAAEISCVATAWAFTAWIPANAYIWWRLNGALHTKKAAQ
ncbi:MAG: hypothetical protein MPL62_10365 [Alphaproteobacteria bacterium]|nr:hypothetical protein [Alphaproteobacteria bacterium]